LKITPTSLTVSQLLGQTNERYIVPPYQRRYSWLERQIGELIDDISLIESNDTHLLGSIVCLAGAHVADLNELEVVDGQQRLTTVSILLVCMMERLQAEGAAEQSTITDIEKLSVAKSMPAATQRPKSTTRAWPSPSHSCASGSLIRPSMS
jgi:uncharacterized protein with ParB-like and HNH nuclease domain